MRIYKDKLVVVNTRRPEVILDNIKKSKVLKTHDNGITEVAVNWGLDEVLQLSELRVRNAPAPISRDYNWPGIHKPFDHQRTTAEFLAANPRAYCLSEAGTGKTSAVIWAADYLMNQHKVHRMLVVCPLSIMQAAWQADFFKTAMHRTVAIAHGAPDKRKKIVNSGADVVVINYDGIEIVEKEIKAGNFDLIVVDEANYVKTTTTRRWKALNRILTPTTWLWMMTGTPASQSPADAYGLAKLVNPSSVPKYAGTFKDMVMQKVGTFRWIPRFNAQDIVFKTLQPAIRFTKADCLDLPDVMYQTREVPLTPQQEKYYKKLKKDFFIEAGGADVTAVNAGVMLTKLLQVSCITGDTEVLCYSGWKRIDSVAIDDLVWDGEEWVCHDGLIYQGDKPVVTIDGVRMTVDHKVHTITGWHTAKEILDGKSSKKFNRTEVRLPDSYSSSRYNAGHFNPMCTMGVSMRMRKYCGSSKPVSQSQTSDSPAQLRMSPRKRGSSYGSDTPISNMAWYAAAMFKSVIQRLPQLWGTRNNDMSAMGRVLSSLLERYARGVLREFNIRPNKCRSWLHPRELSLGYPEATREQYAIQSADTNPTRCADNSRGCKGIWIENGNVTRENYSIQMEHRKGVADSTEAVYDLINCGPRHRFVVKNGANPIIVHNCGSIYSDTGEVVEFDVANRMTALKDIISEASHKVLVFCPFRHSIDKIMEELNKNKITCDVIHGGVNMNKRTQVFKNFQETKDPQVLVIQPQAASHGVTLHAANVVVFWSPVMSVETYIQCCARVDRAGQRNPMTVVHLQGSPVERKIYTMLQNKIDTHLKLVDLYKEEIDA